MFTFSIQPPKILSARLSNLVFTFMTALLLMNQKRFLFESSAYSVCFLHNRDTTIKCNWNPAAFYAYTYTANHFHAYLALDNHRVLVQLSSMKHFKSHKNQNKVSCCSSNQRDLKRLLSLDQNRFLAVLPTQRIFIPL